MLNAVAGMSKSHVVGSFAIATTLSRPGTFVILIKNGNFHCLLRGLFEVIRI